MIDFMSFFNEKIEIPKENPFANCKLGREKYADVLTEIIKTYSSGFVLALDNKWGGGKTTFVKMWQRKLEIQEYKTIYFNAWENDFENNSFIAILAEFKELLGNDKSETFKKLLRKGGQVSKAIIPSITKSLIKKYINDDTSEIIGNGAAGIMEVVQIEIEEYVKRKKTIIDFKTELQNYINENIVNKSLVVIIDELDRCKPSYAIEILETIKHLYSVKNIVFVLSIDKEQLCHAVCGYYGSENLNSNDYLQRFIDIEYSIPKSDIKSFVKFMYSKYDFDGYFGKRSNNNNSAKEKDMFIEISTFLFAFFGLSLRQQERIFAHLRVGLNSFRLNQYVLPELYVYLTMIKLKKPTLYNSILEKKLDHNELLNHNTDLFENVNRIPEDKRNLLIKLEAMLVVMYNNFLDHQSNSKIKLRGDLQTYPKSRMDNTEDQSNFKWILKDFANDWDKGDVSMEFLLNKIELIEIFAEK
jgi:hypothetical protein